tara:strand:+ start:735 stop:983 length:249 start_codon:yes stop_codon:yes gene_type:complete
MTDTPRKISEIANEIARDWGDKTNYAARPYLVAMFSLNSIEDEFIHDSAKSIILYFLANAQTWRGETARRVKAELKAIAGVK